MRQVPRLAFPVVLAYPWVLMLLLGAIVPETFLVYPNVFHDPPASLELGMRFLAVRGPDDVFPPLGFLAWVTCAGALVLAWPVRAARGWVLLGLNAAAAAAGLVGFLRVYRHRLLARLGPPGAPAAAAPRGGAGPALRLRRLGRWAARSAASVAGRARTGRPPRQRPSRWLLA